MLQKKHNFSFELLRTDNHSDSRNSSLVIEMKQCHGMLATVMYGQMCVVLRRESGELCLRRL
jgi:hypothetical protein